MADITRSEPRSRRRTRNSDRLRNAALWAIVLIWFLPAFWIILTSVRRALKSMRCRRSGSRAA